MPRNTYGDTVKKRVKRLLEALLDFVNYEFEGNFDIEFKPETEDVTNPKVIFKTTLVALEQLIAKDKYPGKLKKEQIREALKLLENFLKILKDNRTKTQGSDDWHFTLTLWSKDREKNLKQFDKAWEDSRPEKSKAVVLNYQNSDEFDWHDICGKVLETQQLRRQATAQQYELNIYVPLGLMERPKTPNPRINPTGEESQPQKEPELQIVQTYKDDAFFQKVIAENCTEKPKQIAIIGEAGAGKTTLLGKLVEQLPKNSLDLPICIRLADLQGITIKDYLVNNWLEKAVEHINPVPKSVTPEIIEALKQLFRQSKVWLLLDGVDEMAAESPVLALARIREQLTDWVGKARVVLTCRLNVWDAAISNSLTDFDTYKTLEFEPNDVDQFICQWFEEASQDEKRRNSGNETYWLEQGKRLQQQLKEPGKDNIRRMVRNPLRLSMLCQSWCVSEQDLPETKAALYEQFTTYFFEWKQEEFQKKHQQVLKETEKKQIKQALGKLALTAMESVNRFRIEQEFAIVQMEEEWFNLADELGWLVLVDRDNRTKKPVYSFLHSSFQEYFAALAIDDWDYFLPREHKDRPVQDKDNPKQYKPYRIFEPQWKEVILLWLGREEEDREEKEAFIKGIINFNDGFNGKFYWYRAYFLAAGVITEFRSHFADEIAQQIITWSFDCFYKQVGYFSENLQDAQFHSSIIEGSRAELPEADYPKAVNFILPLLEDKIEYGHIRHEAIKTLGVIGTGNCDAIQALNRIIDDPSEKICCVEIAACSLGKISTENLRLKAIKKIIDLMAIDVHKTAVAYLSQLVFESVNIPFDIVDLVV